MTSIGRQYDEEDLFTSVKSYMQSIIEGGKGVATQASKDDLCLVLEVQGENSDELTLKAIIEHSFSTEQNTFSKMPCDLTTQETYNKDTSRQLARNINRRTVPARKSRFQIILRLSFLLNQALRREMLIMRTSLVLGVEKGLPLRTL